MWDGCLQNLILNECLNRILDVAQYGLDQHQYNPNEVAVRLSPSEGIARDPVTDFAAEKVYFAYRPAESPVSGQPCHWHLMVMNVDGSEARQVTDGQFIVADVYEGLSSSVP